MQKGQWLTKKVAKDVVLISQRGRFSFVEAWLLAQFGDIDKFLLSESLDSFIELMQAEY